jgi:hypothetical protein
MTKSKLTLKLLITLAIMVLAVCILGMGQVNAYSEEDIIIEDKFDIIENTSITNNYLKIDFSLDKLYDLINNKTSLLEQNVQADNVVYDYFYVKAESAATDVKLNTGEELEKVTKNGAEYYKCPIQVAFKSSGNFYTSETYKEIRLSGSTALRYYAAFDYESAENITGAIVYLSNSLDEKEQAEFDQKYPASGAGDIWGGNLGYNRAVANETKCYIIVQTAIDMGKTINLKPIGTLNYIETISNNDYKYKYAVQITDKSLFNQDSIYLELLEKNAYSTWRLEFEGDKIDLSTKEIQKTDNATNVKLDTDTNVVPSNTTLEVKEIKDGQIHNTIIESLKSISNKFVAYDITLKSNGVEIQPNGKVKISLPIPSGYDTNKIVVYRVAEDGTKTKYDTTIDNGYVVIETDHFSSYVIAEENISNNDTSNTNADDSSNKTTEHKKDETPKTGENSIATIISSILSIISLAGITITKKF